jgi:hypothetical protein
VPGDVARERLGLDTGVDLGAGELPDRGPLRGRHRVGGRELDVLWHQPVLHVLPSEVPSPDRHRAPSTMSTTATTAPAPLTILSQPLLSMVCSFAPGACSVGAR